jgi:hypothetical protein
MRAVGLQLEAFLISAPDGDEWSISRLSRLIEPQVLTEEIGWAPHMVRTKRFYPCQESSPATPARS